MNFAVIENNLVTNTIVAESKDIAESILGLVCIEYTDENPAIIGGIYDGSKFIAPQPYASWTLNSNKEWEAPTPCPTIEGQEYVWNEESLSWEIFIPTEENI